MTEQTVLRLVGAAQGFNWLPVFVAERTGLFADQHIEIAYSRLGSVDRATAAVRDGLAEFAITPPEGAVADYVSGGSLRIVASNSERLPMSLVAAPEITRMEDLRGKRIGTSSLTEGTAIYTQSMLATVGLHYPDDYEFVLAGIHTERWSALQAGQIDAAPQPAPWNFLAERAGFTLIGEVADAFPEIIFAAIVANATWLEENADVAQRFLTALSEAHEIVNDPANDSITLPIYQQITTPDDAQLARRGLEYTRELGMWPDRLRVSPAAFAATLSAMSRAGLIGESQCDRAAGVIDSRFVGEESD